jgi:O-Antigen ligase
LRADGRGTTTATVNYRDDMAEEPAEEVRSSHARLEPAAWLALILLAGTWSWWAWQKGAYFGTVLLPGAIVLCAGAALLIRFAPWRARLSLSSPLVIALVALIALGCWALLSALWSPAPDVAIGDGQRILVYAIAFGLGAGLCNLLGPRIGLSLVPLAAAGAFAGLVTAISLATNSSPADVLESDGTLDFPLGYRNAEAAFFAIALFPAVGLAADREADWRLRSVALATATLCVQLFLLAQSRASVPAMAVALVVYALVAPRRVRALAWLALAVVPAAAIIGPLTSLYGAADDGLRGAVDEMHVAGTVALVITLAAAVIGAVAARAETRLPRLGADPRAGNRRVSIGMAVLAVVAVAGFIAAVGDPVHWLGDRADEFRSSGTPDLSENSSRFTFNAGSDRYDAWRVALDDAGDDPLLGDGGGGYQYSYLVKREAQNQNIHDAHSVELEVLAELGVVGLILFAVAIVAAVVGVYRSRQLGPSAASLGAIALSSGAYWLVHTSVDWFWPYPAITAPVLALLGSACAPAVRSPGLPSTRPWRVWATAALAVLAISTIPFWLAERYVNNAYASWRTDLGRAYDDLDQARTLNPFSDTPILAEAAIARAAGDPARALDALSEAAEKRPEEWATHYLLARLQTDSDRAAAREEIALALELNPIETKVRALARRLGVDPDENAPESG